MNLRIKQHLLRNGPMLDTPRLVDLYHLLTQVLAFDVPGDVVDLGCNAGQSAILMREIMNWQASAKELHVYDAFQGLPELEPADAGAVFAQGMLRATRDDLQYNFRAAGLISPTVHSGWFHETLPNELPPLICFAHIDADIHGSIIAALTAVYPRLAPRAIVVIDDYEWEGLPGVKKAVDAFMSDEPETLCPMRLGPTFDAAHVFFRRCVPALHDGAST